MSYLQEIRDYYPEYRDLDDWTLTEQIYGSIPELKDYGMDLDSLGKTLGAQGDKYDRLPGRGILGELGAEVARGARRAVSTGLKASRFFLPESILGIPTEPSREFIADVDEEFTDPDYAYRKGQLSERPGFYKKYVAGGLETAVHSVGAALPGVVAGGVKGATIGAAGGPIGAGIGMALGAGLAGGTAFGLAEHYDFKVEAHELLDKGYTDKYIAQGYNEEEAGELAFQEVEELASPDALKSAFAEAGGEGVSNFLGMLVLGGAGKLIKPIASKIIKNKLGKALVTYAGKTAGLAITEGLPEAATGYLQAIAREKVYKAAGLPIPDREKAAIEGLKGAAKAAPWFALLPGGGAKVDTPQPKPETKPEPEPKKPPETPSEKVMGSGINKTTLDNEVDKLVAEKMGKSTRDIETDFEAWKRESLENIENLIPSPDDIVDLAPGSVPRSLPSTLTPKETIVPEKEPKAAVPSVQTVTEELPTQVAPPAETPPLVSTEGAGAAPELPPALKADEIPSDLSNITISDITIDESGNPVMEIIDGTPQPLTVQRSAKEAMDEVDKKLAPWTEKKDGISTYDRLLNCLAG